MTVLVPMEAWKNLLASSGNTAVKSTIDVDYIELPDSVWQRLWDLRSAEKGLLEKNWETQERDDHGRWGSGSSASDTARPIEPSVLPSGKYPAGPRQARIAVEKDITNAASSPFALKDKVVSQVAERSGLSYERANKLTATWAGSSSDSRTDSLALQEAVRQKFGLETDAQSEQLLGRPCGERCQEGTDRRRGSNE